ncbi:hypothetical protein Rcae01_06577 [Novipirellula caenicola]|uniref:Uncharacterized protein n=1 Tax=Novipirellula caenicola TaxID=1536901 RepID=A0ABP9W106_9BACT
MPQAPRQSVAGVRSDGTFKPRPGEGRGVHTRGDVRCGLLGQPSPEQSPEALLDLSQTLFGRGDMPQFTSPERGWGEVERVL